MLKQVLIKLLKSNYKEKKITTTARGKWYHIYKEKKKQQYNW